MPTSQAQEGFSGKFGIGSTPVYLIQVQSIELQANGETYDVTVMGGLTTAQWKAFLGGLLSYTLKVVGFLDLTNDPVQATLWAALGTVQPFTFSPNAGVNKFTGNAILMTIPIKVAVNAPESIEFDFQGTGAPVYT